ncbi:hypothetical protein Y032_0046g1339 [Ancylostoma ceylanicum]|nr:hypothetical protein Y032_0046g1339 [Ancylostoma ceylanicum]
MDAMLQCLFVLIYIEIVALATISFCARKQMKSVTPEKVEPPRRIYAPPLRPRKIELNQKEVLIKGGLTAGRLAYPTLDDIKSDWSERDEKDNKKSAASTPHEEAEKEKNTRKLSPEKESDNRKQDKKEEAKKMEGRSEEEKKQVVVSGIVESGKCKENKISNEKLEDGSKTTTTSKGSKSAEGKKSGEKMDEERKNGQAPAAVH